MPRRFAALLVLAAACEALQPPPTHARVARPDSLALHSSAPQSGRGPGLDGGRRGGGRGRGGDGGGDWPCKACGFSNFASRSACFKCGEQGPKRPPRSQQRGRRKNWSWLEEGIAGGAAGPKEVVAALATDVWWLRPDAIDDADVAAVARARGLDAGDAPARDDLINAAKSVYSLDDDNFVSPAFNPWTKEPKLCQPEVYEKLARDGDADAAADSP